MGRSQSHRSRSNPSPALLWAVVLSLSIVIAPAAEGATLAAPGDFGQTPTADATAKKRGKCARKKTKKKRRACRRRRQLDRLAGDFSGSMTTTVSYFSFCSNQFVGSETYQIQNVRVSVRRPLDPTPLSPGLPPAAGNENNPINLVVGQTTVADSTTPGSVFLASAFRYGATSPPVILESWRLRLQGSNLTGVLFEDNREQAAAQNLLAAWKALGCGPNAIVYPDQYAIGEGTTLTGTLTRDAVQLRVTGNTSDGSRPFVTEIATDRAG